MKNKSTLWVYILSIIICIALIFTSLYLRQKNIKNNLLNDPTVIAFNQGNLDETIKRASAFLEANPKSVNSLLALSSAYSQKGSLEFKEVEYGQMAADLAKEAITLEPNNSLAYINLGYANEIMRKYDDAIKSYTKAISLDPSNVDAYAHRGHAYDISGNLKSAGDDYLKAESLDSSNFLVASNLGRLFAREGRVSEAVEQFKLVTKSPNARLKADAYYDLSGIAFYSTSSSAVDESLSFASSSLKSDPTYPNAYLALGRVYVVKKDYNDAEVLLSKALSIYPDFSLAYDWLARMYVQKGDIKKALNTYDLEKVAITRDIGVMENDRKSAISRTAFDQSVVYLNDGQTQKAISTLKESIDNSDFKTAVVIKYSMEKKDGMFSKLQDNSEFKNLIIEVDTRVKELIPNKPKVSYLKKALNFVLGFIETKEVSASAICATVANGNIYSSVSGGAFSQASLDLMCNYLKSYIEGNTSVSAEMIAYVRSILNDQSYQVGLYTDSSNGYLTLGCSNGFGVWFVPSNRSCVGPDGSTLTSGSSRIYYNQSNPPSCTDPAIFQRRTCTDGTLSGSDDYRYTNCTHNSCYFISNAGTITIPDGTNRTVYNTSSAVNCLATTTSRTLACNNGSLTGLSSGESVTFTYGNCSNTGCIGPDGYNISSGSSRRYYNQPNPSSCTDPSLYQNRSCTNGVLSGSNDYRYTNCAHNSCYFTSDTGTIVIPSGTSRTVYNTSSAVNCSATTTSRTISCNNGSLSGLNSSETFTFRYGNCSNTGCTGPDGYNIPSGTSRRYYNQQNPSSCTDPSLYQNRSCANGVLSGSDDYRYTNCTRNSCYFTSNDMGTIVIPDGVSRTIYNTSSAVNCSATTTARAVTCSNGSLTGLSGVETFTFKYGGCSNSACTGPDGTVITNLSRRNYYRVAVAPVCSLTGLSQLRTCNNAILSGSDEYQYRTCSNNACTAPDGTVIADGASRTLYNATSSTDCSSSRQTRTCSGGVLSGSSSYRYLSCSVAPATTTPSRSCTGLLGETIASGDGRSYYSTSTSLTCSSYVRSFLCNNGVLNPPNLGITVYSSCHTPVSDGTASSTPTINLFSAVPFWVRVGGSCGLKYDVSGNDCVITGGGITQAINSGSGIYKPTKGINGKTTYTLTCGASGDTLVSATAVCSIVPSYTEK